MGMSRKDYEMLASIIKSASPALAMQSDEGWCNGCNGTREFIAHQLAVALHDSNPNFNIKKFLSACNVGVG